LPFLSSKIDFIIFKTDDKQFTLTTKKSLHIIFNMSRFENFTSRTSTPALKGMEKRDS